MEYYKSTQILCLFVISILGPVIAYAEVAPDAETAVSEDDDWV